MSRSIIYLTVALLLGQPSFARDPEVAGPRDGKYRIFTSGVPSSSPIFLGHFVLAGGTYRSYLPGDKLEGEGRYSFHFETQSVTWDSGPFKGLWQGAFVIEREGKTHKIRLKSNIIATNSTDSAL